MSALARIIELGQSFQAAKTLLSAVELGVFTALADGPLDAAALRARIGIGVRGATDFFDALVALDLIERDVEGKYHNNPEGNLYLDRRKPTYIGSALEFLNWRHFAPWASLTDALRRGGPGTSGSSGHYPALYADAAMLELFAKGMTGGCRLVAPAIVEQFPWRNYRTVIDIGTAEGCLPVEIARAHPHIRGGGFDLPALMPWFDDYVRRHSLSDRLRFFAGDFFQQDLPSADVLIMGRILHNWDLPRKRMLLKSAHNALPTGGALIVYERFIDDERRTAALALLMSLHMLIMTEGGFAFTAADCLGWMRETGFGELRVTPLAMGYSMIIGLKKA